MRDNTKKICKRTIFKGKGKSFRIRKRFSYFKRLKKLRIIELKVRVLKARRVKVLIEIEELIFKPIIDYMDRF